MTAPVPMDEPLALYVHWPFCAKKCPYCDFNVHVRRTVDHGRWAAALVQEFETLAARLDRPRPLVSIHFGGGTPSLMAPETVAAVIAAARRFPGLAGDAEIGLEANPSGSDAASFAAFRDAGVNRLSLGVQALDDASLAALGRWHDAAEAAQAIRTAMSIFPNVSLDLMHGREGQTPEAWARELEAALAFAPQHLSLYALTIEPGTPFALRQRRGTLALPPDDVQADMDLAAERICAAAGLARYEVSNYARPGFESVHNRVYWTYGEYIGIGPGAHGRIISGGYRISTVTKRKPELWLASVEADGHGLAQEDALLPQEQADELLLMGLRLSDGVSLRRYAALSGRPLPEHAVNALVHDGLLRIGNGHVHTTAKGRLILDEILRRLMI